MTDDLHRQTLTALQGICDQAAETVAAQQAQPFTVDCAATRLTGLIAEMTELSDGLPIDYDLTDAIGALEDAQEKVAEVLERMDADRAAEEKRAEAEARSDYLRSLGVTTSARV